MYCNIHQIEEDLGKKVTTKLDESYRTTNNTLCCQLQNGTYRYVVWGQGDYLSLERAYYTNKLMYMHEVLRMYKRVRGDIDLEGEKLEEFRKLNWTIEQLITNLTVILIKTIHTYYQQDTITTPKVVWLNGAYVEKISLHYIINGVVFQDKETDREEDLRKFNTLLTYEMSKSQEFRNTKTSIFLDTGITNGVMFRMPNAMKLSKNIPLVPVNNTLKLHQLLVCMWRREDRTEFFRIAKLNPNGESLFEIPKNIDMGQMVHIPTRIKQVNKTEQQLPVKTLLEFTEDFPEFEPKDEDEFDIRLERINTSYCQQCKREHDKDNAKIYEYNGRAYYKCWRSEYNIKPILLGRTSLEDTRKLTNKKEKICQEDVKSILPISRQFELRIQTQNLTSELQSIIKLLLTDKHILIRSAIDTGKTALLIELLLRFGWKKVLIPTVRIRFAESLAERLKSSGLSVRLYTTELNRRIDGEGIFLIQIESLSRFEEDRCVLVMDELESIIRQISNDTTMDPIRKTHTWEKLITLVKNCEYFLGLDAHISNRSVEFVSLVTGRQPTIIDNTYKHPERQIVELATFDVFCNTMEKLAKDKKRLFIWMASKEKAIQLLKILARVVGRDKILFIHDGVAIGDVDKEWTKYDVVLVTPSITLGVSFNVRDYFHHVCLYVSPYSCGPRDCVQAIGRVRHPIDGRIYMHVCSIPYHSITYEPDTIKTIEEHLKKHANQAENIAKESKCIVRTSDNIHSVVLRMSVLNMLEENLGKRCFRALLEWYLKFSNIVIGVVLDEAIIQDDNISETPPILTGKDMRLLESDTSMKYDAIHPIQDGARLMGLIRSGEATTMQRSQANVWCFHHVIMQSSMSSKLYDEYWNNREKKMWLYNQRAEKMPMIQLMEQYRDHNTNSESMFASVLPDRVKIIKQLCERLGIPNTGTPCVVSRQVIERLILEDDIETRLGIRYSRSNKQDTNAKCRRLNIILGTWSGGSLKSCRKRVKVDGKFIDIGDFAFSVLEEGRIWNVLRI